MMAERCIACGKSVSRRQQSLRCNNCRQLQHRTCDTNYHKELVTVNQELSGIEEQLDELLQRQAELLGKRKELEKILKQSTAKPEQNVQWNKTDFKWSGDLQQKLEDVFGIKQLRPMQLQTMNVTMSGKDCILIMPTGGGKSLCFHLPALLSQGITLVVSPLVSLMEDQVMALQGYGVDATMLNAATPKDVLKQVQQAMVDKHASLKLLYVTPEKLSKSKRFMAQLEKTYKAGRFARLVIDEVHCCSQWGHDFRPDYKFLGIMKRQFPDVPILGLTATATTSVLDDVRKILNIQHCQLFRASFNRPNLFYEIRGKPSVQKEVMEDIQRTISTRFHGQSGIVYTFSRKESEDVTMELQSRGIKAGCYHADLSAKERSRVHRAWINDKIHVVVATVAFGMGIDKPDVRFVIHHSLSKSMENLYQESGRAGRDEKKSHCIVYYRLQDVFRQSSMVMAEQTGLRNLYGIMEYCTDTGRCRRSMIARYFGEVWDRSQCNKMCDHCNASYTVEKKDVTQYCVNVMKIVDNAATADQRLTAIKLMDAWQGRGPSYLRVKGTDTGTDRHKLETIVANLLLKEYLKEEFHFTPYSTISYLLPGRKADRLRNGVDKVFVDFPGKVKAQSSSPGQSGEKNLTDQKNSGSQKPKLVVINSDKSAFTQMTNTGNSVDKPDNPSKIKKSNSMQLKKRKSFVVDSDSDLDGLDFGDSGDVKSKSKKMKKNSECSKSSENGERGHCADKGDNPSKIKKSNSTQLKKRKTIVLDSDSDSEGVDFGDDVGNSKGKEVKMTSQSSIDRKGDCSVNGSASSGVSSKRKPLIIESDSDNIDDDSDDGIGNGDMGAGPSKNCSISEEEQRAAIRILDSDSDFE